MAFCAAETCGLAAATVMPRPTAAGVLGIERTTAVRAGRWRFEAADRAPRRHRQDHGVGADHLGQRRKHLLHDLRLHRHQQHGRRPRRASAPRHARGCHASPGARRCAAAALDPGPGCASGSRPRSSHPASSAPPMLPAPASTRSPSSFNAIGASARMSRQKKTATRDLSGRARRMASTETLRRSGAAQAWPWVSNMVEASASRLSRPAQTTNWKDW